jgi:hypothetical protein
MRTTRTSGSFEPKIAFLLNAVTAVTRKTRTIRLDLKCEELSIAHDRFSDDS